MNIAKNGRSFIASAVVATLFSVVANVAFATVIYDTTSNPLPPNQSSWGYKATSTSQLGDLISFGGTARTLQSATVTLSTWAYQSLWAGSGYSNPNGYFQNLTLNFYNVDNSGATPALGSLLTSKTDSFLIPWRPEPTTDCANGAYSVGNFCYNGMAFNVGFDFSALGIVLPSQVIFGLSFSTRGNGPYDSLNFAFAENAPSVGSNVESDELFINTTDANNLGIGTVGQFSRDNGWNGDTPAIQINATAVPEPGTLALFGLAFVGLVATCRRKFQA